MARSGWQGAETGQQRGITEDNTVDESREWEGDALSVFFRKWLS